MILCSFVVYIGDDNFTKSFINNINTLIKRINKIYITFIFLKFA